MGDTPTNIYIRLRSLDTYVCKNDNGLVVIGHVQIIDIYETEVGEGSARGRARYNSR
jgi:hypothetical protein